MKNLILLLLIFGTEANAINYYISPKGNDASNGTSVSTPWKTISKVNNHFFLPGDVIMFQRGGVWRETLFPLSSGTTDNPITFSAYGTGAKPVLNGADIYTGDWAVTATRAIWSINSPLPNDVTPTMMIDETICSRVNSLSSIGINTFYIDKTPNPDKIYIYSKPRPIRRRIEISTRQFGIFVGSKSNIVISNFNLINCLYAGLRFDGRGMFDGNEKTYFNGYSTVDGVTASNSVIFGIVTGNGYSHTTIKNSTAYSNGNGFYADGNGDHTLFQNDTSFNNYNQTDPYTDGNGFGVYKSSFNIIENCLAYNNKSASGIEIDLDDTDSAIVIRYNVVYGNGSLLEGYGIKIGNVAGLASSNNVYYNLSYLNGVEPIDRMGREFSHHNGNISFYNNTVYTTGTSTAYGITIAGPGKAVVINNLVYSFGGSHRRCIRSIDSPVLVAENNLYYSTAATPFASGSSALDLLGWQSLGYDEGSGQADPVFTTNGTDFTLHPESPAINKGEDVGLTKDISGNPIIGLPDIGAFEFATTASDKSAIVNARPTAEAGTVQVITLSEEESNLCPVADAGDDQIIALTSNYTTLNGNKSYDTDGSIFSYNWQQIKGPGLSTFSSSDEPVITLTNLQEGDYSYKLTISDNKNATATAIVNVTIVNNLRIYGPVGLYPNPAINVVNIVLNSDSNDTVLINIYDMQGRKVMQSAEVHKTIGVYTDLINVSQLRSGIYTVEAILNRKRKMVSKFVKM